MLQHHANRTLTDLWRERLPTRHDSILLKGWSLHDTRGGSVGPHANGGTYIAVVISGRDDPRAIALLLLVPLTVFVFAVGLNGNVGLALILAGLYAAFWIGLAIAEFRSSRDTRD